MINRDTIEKIQEMSSPELINIYDATFSKDNLNVVRAPKPDTLKGKSLNSLIDYIKKDIDGEWKSNNNFVHISSYDEVKYYTSAPKSKDAERTELFRVVPFESDGYSFSRFYSPTDFLIWLNACFDRNQGDWGTVTKLASQVKVNNSADIEDNGVAQEITVKAGVSLAKKQEIPNPVLLAPFRTFAEIEQPLSPFVLRADEHGNLALFVADGGAWKLEAVERINIWLKENLDSDSTPILY